MRIRLLSVMRLQLMADEATGTASALVVELLDGTVLWDWDAYVIAREIGFPLRFEQYDGGDPVAHLCLRGLHVRPLSQSHKALIVVSMCGWVSRGRPKREKSTESVDFSDNPTKCRTTVEMAELARVGTTLISQAKVVSALGLTERVLAGALGFADAYRRARVVCGCGLEKSVQSGETSFDRAYQQALSEVPISGEEKNQSGWSDRAVLRDQIRYLEGENARLLEQVALLRVENEEQKSAATALGNALKRERKRSEAAEAEVDTLRKQLERPRIEP